MLETHSIQLVLEISRREACSPPSLTVYAFMQAMGLVNDHLEGCDARAMVEKARQQFERPAA